MKYHPARAAAGAVRSLSTGAKLAIGALATGGMLAGGVVLATGAGASTKACNSTGYCGTQADAQANPMYLALQGPVADINAGTPVLGERPDLRSREFDFNFTGLHGDQIRYAPYGHVTHLCVAGHGDGRVNLRPCNDAYAIQTWTANDLGNGYFTITNGAGLVLTLTTNGSPATVVNGSMVSQPTTRQQFKFVEQ